MVLTSDLRKSHSKNISGTLPLWFPNNWTVLFTCHLPALLCFCKAVIKSWISAVIQLYITPGKTSKFTVTSMTFDTDIQLHEPLYGLKVWQIIVYSRYEIHFISIVYASSCWWSRASPSFFYLIIYWEVGVHIPARADICLRFLLHM